MSLKFKNIVGGCALAVLFFTVGPAYSQDATTKVDTVSHDHAHAGKSESKLLESPGPPMRRCEKE